VAGAVGEPLVDTQHVERSIYRVVWSDEDQASIARVAEAPSLAAHGSTADAARQELARGVHVLEEDAALAERARQAEQRGHVPHACRHPDAHRRSACHRP
jgi:hypothetical protein